VLYQGLISVGYEVDFWGENAATLESARASAEAARFARQVVWITTSTGVADLYLQNLALLDQLRIARVNLAHARLALDDISAAERHGTLPRLAVIQQEAAVASIEALLPPLRGQLAATQNALAVLVGVLPEHLRLGGRSLLGVTLPRVTVGISSGLLIRRPDIQEAETNLLAANADIRVARAQFLPSLTLPLSGGMESMTVRHRGTVAPIGALAGLRGGTGTVLDVLQSQSAVLAAQDAVVQARLAYARASLGLIKALGGGWKL
jgi:outer membrane protein TolC